MNFSVLQKMNCKPCHEPMTALFGHATTNILANRVGHIYNTVEVYETEYVCENVGCYNYNKIIFVWTESENDTIL